MRDQEVLDAPRFGIGGVPPLVKQLEKQPSGEVPTGFDEIVNSGFLRWKDVTDPWGRKFAFRSEKKKSTAFGEEYEIFVYSVGPDGTANNRDDIYI